MVELTNAEKEIHLNMTGDDHGTWSLVTDDPYWIRRMETIGAEFVRDIGYSSKEYRLDRGQVTIRKKLKARQITEEQRIRGAKNLARYRATKTDSNV